MAERSDVDLVLAARAGDSGAFGELYERWFDRVHDVAWHILHDHSAAADVGHDVFLVAWQSLETLREPASFGGWLLRTSRNKALNRLSHERRARSTDDDTELDLGDHADVGADLDRDEHRDLVWAASAALGEHDASILSLHLRHGLSGADLAEELGVEPNHAHQLLFRLRERLERAIEAWVVWRNGSPACDELRTVLRKAGSAAFGAETAKIVNRHAAGCGACSGRRDERLQPAQLFAAVPVVVAPVLLKAKSAAALEAAGVPMGTTPANLSVLAAANGPIGPIPAARTRGGRLGKGLAMAAAAGCPTGLTHNLAWASTGADNATLVAPGHAPQTVQPDGTTSVCAPRGTVFTLTAAGPGGTDTATASAN